MSTATTSSQAQSYRPDSPNYESFPQEINDSISEETTDKIDFEKVCVNICTSYSS